MATTIPTLPVYTGKTPVIGQNQPEFNINRADKLAYDAQLFGEEGVEGALNTTIEAINTASTEIETNAAAAEVSAQKAEDAAAVVGYLGEWTPSTDVQIGGIYGYQGSEWRSLTGADVEPVEGDDWRKVIDQKDITTGQEELIDGVVFPEKGDLEVGMTVTIGTTHLRVDGAIYAMSPIASGTVSTLTETSATIGGTAVTLAKLSIDNLVFGEGGRKYEIVAFTLRNYGTVGSPDWQFIDDSIHRPTNGASVSVVGRNIRVNFGKTYSKIVSLIAAPDETMARRGFMVGASVGTSTADIEVSARMIGKVNGVTGMVTVETHWGSDISASVDVSGKVRVTHPTNSAGVPSGFLFDNDIGVSATLEAINSTTTDILPLLPLSGYVTCTGVDYTVSSQCDGVSVSGSSGVVTVTHPLAFTGSYPAVTSRYSTVIAMADTVASDNFTVKFRDFSGSPVLSDTTENRFYFQRDALVPSSVPVAADFGFDLGRSSVDASNLVVAGGNIWVIGVFEK